MDYSIPLCKKNKKELIKICKERKIKGYSGKSNHILVEMLVKHDQQKIDLKKIEDLEIIKKFYENKQAQRGLINLYSQSQAECMRNGVCGMEIGMSREKDQGAVLKLFLGDKINLDINNNLPEDFIVGNEKISSKHSSGKIGGCIKVKWTSADTSVKDAIQNMIDADDSYYPNLLITYFDRKAKKMTIICITSENNKNAIKTLKEEAFKIPNGNSRGIEYSSKAMKYLLDKPYFTIEILDVELNGGLNPIERRLNLLKSMGICP